MVKHPFGNFPNPFTQLKEIMHTTRLVGLGAFATAQKQSGQLLQRLIHEGAQLEAQWFGERPRIETPSDPNYREQLLDARIAWILKKREIPTREDWQMLYRQLHDIEQQISALSDGQESSK